MGRIRDAANTVPRHGEQGNKGTGCQDKGNKVNSCPGLQSTLPGTIPARGGSQQDDTLVRVRGSLWHPAMTSPPPSEQFSDSENINSVSICRPLCVGPWSRSFFFHPGSIKGSHLECRGYSSKLYTFWGSNVETIRDSFINPRGMAHSSSSVKESA